MIRRSQRPIDLFFHRKVLKVVNPYRQRHRRAGRPTISARLPPSSPDPVPLTPPTQSYRSIYHLHLHPPPDVASTPGRDFLLHLPHISPTYATPAPPFRLLPNDNSDVAALHHHSPPRLTNIPERTSRLFTHDSDEDTTSPLTPKILFSHDVTPEFVPPPPFDSTPPISHLQNLPPSASPTSLSPHATPFLPTAPLPPLLLAPPDATTQWKALFNYHHDYRRYYEQPTRTESKLSTMNLTNNLPWGDTLSLNKPPNTIRLYVQNVNGIKIDMTGGELVPICVTLSELSCDIIGFSELKLDTTQYPVKKILESTLRSQFRHVKTAYSTSEIPFSSFYKPGGTFTLAVDHVTSRFCSNFEDKLGRWSTLSFNGRNGRIVHFITVYQVVRKDDSGPYTAYEQQRVSLRAQNRDLKPRPAFILDFTRYLTELSLLKTAQFVVMGDFNEIVGTDASGFAKITSQFNLVDVQRHFHTLKAEVPTYARGSSRLDYIFCSTPLLLAVRSCGVEPFNQHIFSDHRALFVDWDELLLFGSTAPPLVSTSQRLLLSKSLPSRHKYITELHKYCTDHKIFQRLDRLALQPNSLRAEAIDRDVTRGMAFAESGCRNLGTDPWSIQLQKARLLVSVFKTANSMAKTGIDLRPQLNQTLAKHLIPIDIPDDHSEIALGLRESQNALAEVRRLAVKHRKDFLAKKVAAATVNLDKHSPDYKRIIKAEEMKALYAKLRFISKTSTRQAGINRLDVPTNPTDDPKTCVAWTTVDTPEAITQHLLARNKLHFKQADGTPFTVPPLNIQVDFSASTESCELMLEGEYDTSDLDALTAHLVDHFRLLTDIDVLPPTITEQAMMDKYKFWPESTSTSPSGRHLGHYRTLLPSRLPVDPKNPAAVAFDAQRTALISIHHSIVDYALTNSYSYKRWQKVVTVMIEKDPGNPRIHRLRVIHLYEADYNLLLGIKWRALIHHCEDNKLLHPNLYGARPGRGAHDPVLIEELVAEITRMSRKPTIKNAEDATACYDRIIPGIGNLASRCHGLHRQVALVHGKTLSEVKYHLKSQLGVSEESYHHCAISPIYGTGQGSGNSPTIWLVISSLLFSCYDAKAFGARFESPDKTVCIDIYRVGFVDDTCGYVNLFNLDIPPTPEKMIELLTHDSQLWSDLLWKSGGSLELTKCTYHYWNYTFQVDGTPLLEGCQVGPSVVLSTGDGQHTQTVPYCSAYKAYKTLGCYKSPIGTQTTQFQVLKQKCDHHARIVATSALSRQEAWVYYLSMYLTSPGYPLPVCHFTPSQLRSLESKSLPAIISRTGFNRNSSRNIMFGPSRLNGAGFRPFAVEQGVGQVQFFLKHWTTSLEPGRLLRIAVSWSQINVGVGYSIFSDVTSSLPHWESKWLQSVRSFLKSINGKFRLDTPFVPPIQRVNDSYLMDHVLERGDFTPVEIRRINYCRLYLQALTVCDISTATGNCLAPGIEDGLVTLWSGVTRYHKTHQAKPNKASWKLWRRALGLIADPDGYLFTPLLQWIPLPHEQHQQWPVYYDPTSDRIFFRKNGGYESHRHLCGTFDYKNFGFERILPSTAYPVTLEEHPNGWVIESTSSYCPLLPTAPPSSFESFCSLLDQWESQLLQSIVLHYSPYVLIDMLENDSFQACSDGSAVTLQGTYGWVLSTSDGTRLAYGAGPVDGHDPHSFRSEGQGMLSIVCFLSRLLQWTHSTSALSGTLATDNSGLLDRVREQQKQTYPLPNATFKSDWDVVESIVQTLHLTTVSVSLQHVLGHQDKEVPFEDLGLLAQLNVEADRYAGLYQKSMGRYRPIIPLSPTRPIALDIDGKTIHRKFKQSIRDAASADNLLEEMQVKYDWPDGTLEIIDWEAHRQSTQLPLSKRTHYVKLCHEMLPVGKLVSQYGQGLPDYCPLCQSAPEDHVHVLKCPHPTRQVWRESLLESLLEECHSRRTDQDLIDILLAGIDHWLADTPFDESIYDTKYHQLLQDQRQIGWKHIFQARFSTEWASLQQAHLDGLKPIKGQDGASWSKGILSHILLAWNTLWASRNLSRHGADTSEKAISLKEQAMRELEALYSLRPFVLQRDQSIFLDTIDQHKTRPTHSIRQFLNTYRPLLLQSAKDAKKKDLLHMKTMKQYYGAKAG